MRALVMIVASLSGLLVAASFAGALHPAGDSLAVFRLPLAAVFALAVIWSSWPRRWRWPLALAALAAMASTIWPRPWPADAVPQAGWTLYQQNLRYDRNGAAAWRAGLAAVDPDVITLQEVSGRNRVIVTDLAEAYPAAIVCDFAAVGAVAVLSRLEPVPGMARCAPGQGLAAMQVETGAGRVWLVSVHLHWPWPFGQPAQVDALVPVLEALDGPVVMAGDFNAVGWSHAIRRMAAASNSRRLGPDTATFRLPGVAMPVTIDHVLAAPALAGSVTVMPPLGSDHNGVVARLAAPARSAEIALRARARGHRRPEI